MPNYAAFARIKGEVFAVTWAVPEGRVTTYATVGEHLGVMARYVAYILATLTEEERLDVPWHRALPRARSSAQQRRALRAARSRLHVSAMRG